MAGGVVGSVFRECQFSFGSVWFCSVLERRGRGRDTYQTM